MSEQSTTARRRPGPLAWLGLGAALAAVLVLLVLIAVACGAGSDDPDDRSGVGSASPAGGAGPVSGDPDGDDGGSDGGGSGTGDDDSGGQEGDGDGGPGDGGASATPAPTGPEIEYFRMVQEPQCPGGTDNFPTEGQPVTLEWRVNGTTEVTLSIDGPGVYNSYPAEGSDTINFPCAGQEGDIQQHTYLLTAQDADGTSTATLVVEATVHVRSDT